MHKVLNEKSELGQSVAKAVAALGVVVDHTTDPQVVREISEARMRLSRFLQGGVVDRVETVSLSMERYTELLHYERSARESAQVIEDLQPAFQFVQENRERFNLGPGDYSTPTITQKFMEYVTIEQPSSVKVLMLSSQVAALMEELASAKVFAHTMPIPGTDGKEWIGGSNQGLHMLKTMLLERPSYGEAALSRFCPDCGHVGEVDYRKHRNCCPDGSAARYVPSSIAVKMRKLFLDLLAADVRPQAGEYQLKLGTDRVVTSVKSYPETGTEIITIRNNGVVSQREANRTAFRRRYYVKYGVPETVEDDE